MKKLLFLILLATIIQPLRAQSPWRNTRHCVVAAAGGTVFMGDLGGNSKGKNNLFTFEVPRSIKLAGMLGYRYRLADRLACRANVLFTNVEADDADSKNLENVNRNLNFKSSLLDINFTLDYYFIREKEIPRYQSNSFWMQWSGYFFVGLGTVHFNPKGEYEGNWYELQPLCTEGQGTNAHIVLDDKVVTVNDPYKLWAVTVPIGIGFKYQLNRNMSIGIEFSQHFTSTDYIDDCSSYYFDYDKYGIEPPNSLTKSLADKRLYNRSGTMRGNPNINDTYFTMMATIYYRFFSDSGSD